MPKMQLEMQTSRLSASDLYIQLTAGVPGAKRFGGLWLRALSGPAPGLRDRSKGLQNEAPAPAPRDFNRSRSGRSARRNLIAVTSVKST